MNISEYVDQEFTEDQKSFYHAFVNKLASYDPVQILGEEIYHYDYRQSIQRQMRLSSKLLLKAGIITRTDSLNGNKPYVSIAEKSLDWGKAILVVQNGEPLLSKVAERLSKKTGLYFKLLSSVYGVEITRKNYKSAKTAYIAAVFRIMR